MSKSVIRLLTLANYATAPVVVPMVTQTKAATSSSGKIEKNRKKNQNGPGVSDPRSSGSPWPPPMNDDPDRKASGGGGM